MKLLMQLLAILLTAAGICTGVNAACTDAAAPGVNWSGCNKNGIRVPGANLSGANLSGATFNPTQKYEADFSNANLSGANFTGSQISGANFAGANLSGAIWIDGKVCATPSIGGCKAATLAGGGTTTAPVKTVDLGAYKSEFYWKASYGRGVGTVPDLVCPSGKNKVGALCYDPCPAGYGVSGLQCVKPCPSGYSDTGLTCHFNGQGMYAPGLRTETDWCAYRSDRHCVDWGPAGTTCTGGDCMPRTVTRQDDCRSGYHNEGGFCYVNLPEGFTGSPLDPVKPSKPIGAPIAMVQTCGGKQLDAGLCYEFCRSEYNGVGPVCWSKTPSGYVDCGFGIAMDKEHCAKVITLQTLSVAFLAAEFLPAAAAATAAKEAQFLAKTGQTAKLEALIKEMPAFAKVIEAELRALGPIAKELDDAIKAGQSVNNITTKLMNTMLPILLKSEFMFNMGKLLGTSGYGMYEQAQSGEELSASYERNKNNPSAQLLVVRDVFSAFSMAMAIAANRNMLPGVAGIMSGVFDVIGNYAYPIY
jgi:hypothetical protein